MRVVDLQNNKDTAFVNYAESPNINKSTVENELSNEDEIKNIVEVEMETK